MPAVDYQSLLSDWRVKQRQVIQKRFGLNDEIYNYDQQHHADGAYRRHGVRGGSAFESNFSADLTGDDLALFILNLVPLTCRF